MRVVQLALGAVLLASTAAVAQEAPTTTLAPDAAPAGYTLAWADEFTVDGPPNPANWIFERGFARNEELQWYQPDNARCAGGMLTIEARRERKPNPTYDAGSTDWRKQREVIEYTAASLTTSGLHAWQYGIFEMRARIDTRPGLWPAFWTLGVKGQWPHNGEIDIMEYYRQGLLANAAWGNKGPWQAVWDSTKTPLPDLGDPIAWASAFHLWRMDWTPEQIILSVDGRTLNTIDLTQTINRDDGTTNPFHQPHYLLLNLAVGGQNGGDPSQTSFPARYDIDYVRVYQRTP